MPTAATKVRFPLVLAAGVCFGGALLLQIGSAEIGRFGLMGSLLMVVAGFLLPMVAAGSLLWTWLRTSLAATAQATGPRSVVTIACAVVAAAASAVFMLRWVQPTENLLGGYDEGIYAITAANLAQTGHYRLKATLLPSLPAEVRPLIITEFPRMANRTVQPPPSYPSYHACLFIADEQEGTLVSQFPVGFPALLGSAHCLFGFKGQRFTNPIVLFTAACVAGALMTSWLGLLPGTAVFVLWLWFPLQAWAGNSRYAEVLLQLLWLLTLLGLAGRERHPAWSGWLSGLTLGVALAVKIDALPAVGIAAAAIVIVTCRKERDFFRSFLVALVLSVAISAFALWQDNRDYALDVLRAFAETNRGPLYFGTALLGLGCLAWVAARRSGWLAMAVKSWPKAQPWFTGVLVGGGLAIAAYAYFVRSHPAVPDTFFYWPQNREINSCREETFVRFGWYWQPWGLALAVLGMGIAIRCTHSLWQGLAIGIGLLYLITFTHDIRNNPIQPYAMRRFSPYAIPLMIMGAAVLAEWLPRTWARIRSCLAMVIVAGLLMGFWPINERLNGKTEYAGLAAQVDLLAKKIPDRAVLLVRESEPIARLGSCLEFAYGKPCLIVREKLRRDERGEALRRACVAWQNQGRQIFVFSEKPGDTLGMPGVVSRAVDQGIIRTGAIKASAQTLVTEQRTSNLRYSLNEISPSSLPPKPAPPNHAP